MNSFTNEPLGIKGPSTPEAGKSDGGDYALVDSKGLIIGEAFRLVDQHEERPALANAVLWSIAPQMFDALEQCERTLTGLSKSKFGISRKKYGDTTIGHLLGYVRGVISKAQWRPIENIDEQILFGIERDKAEG